MKLRLDIDGGACLLLALLCLTIPLKWLCAAALAAAVHEVCHILPVTLFGGKICRLDIGPFGAVMESSLLEPLPQLLCVLAGPAGSILLFFFYPLFPRTALCALVQGLFNLLPVEPLDGGRALRCFCSLFAQEGRVEVICRIVRWTVMVFLLLLSVWASLWLELGIVALFPGMMVLWKQGIGKIPCKEGHLRVQ